MLKLKSNIKICTNKHLQIRNLSQQNTHKTTIKHLKRKFMTLIVFLTFIYKNN